MLLVSRANSQVVTVPHPPYGSLRGLAVPSSCDSASLLTMLDHRPIRFLTVEKLGRPEAAAKSAYSRVVGILPREWAAF